MKIQKGTIHAIIGENGAGKSTAMKMLYGSFHPDSGEIWVHGKLWGGRTRPWGSPRDAIDCGIGMVHQHFMLSAPHTALDNILLGVEGSYSFFKWLPKPLRPISRDQTREKLDDLADQFGLKVDWAAKIQDLSVGIQQRIEILKLLYRDAEILILDEPTAVLTPQETSDLFVQLKRLCAMGKTIIIITHKLKEVMSIASHVTVFRCGKVVGERETVRTQVEELATLMVGRKVKLNADIPPPPVLKDPVLEVSHLNLNGHPSLKDLTLNVRSGEIVGIAGVEGNGQAELLKVLLQPRMQGISMTGTVKILGTHTVNLSAEQVRELGVGVIPDDRIRDGLLGDQTVRNNFLLGLQRRKPFSRNGILSVRSLTREVSRAIEEFDIRPPNADAIAGSLSGGNQQKLIIAREFRFSPRFFIAAQPTRGVDVGAIEFIHKRIIEARTAGSGVLLISSELEEILALSDRILVMYGGRIVAEFNRGEATEQALGLHMGGAH